MDIIKASSKSDLLKQINELNTDCEEIYISLRPTKEIIDKIVERCSSLEKLCCPQSLLKQTAKKAFRHASDKNITVQAGDFDVGRPKKYLQRTINEIVSQKRIGKPAKQIASEMDIPLRTVYFYLQHK